MRKRYELVAIVIIIALVVSITSVAAYDILRGNGGNNVSKTDSFISQPVVDVIIPSLFKQGSTGGVNAPLNVTVGQSIAVSVLVYSSVIVNATMQFKIYPLSVQGPSQNASQVFSWLFTPARLLISPQNNGNVSLHLNISQTTSLGTYSAVVSAVNANNVSQVWGDVMQVNVS